MPQLQPFSQVRHLEVVKLADYKYPPVTQDDVYKEIFEQAENFKKYKK